MTGVAVAASPVPILAFFDNQGKPAVGGSVLTQVGGVNAPTYQDAAGATALPNPIPLNSRGEISDSSGHSQQLFLPVNTVYTFTIFDKSGNQIDQASYVNSIALTGEGMATLLQSITDNPILASLVRSAGEIASGIAPVDFTYPPLNVFRYMTSVQQADVRARTQLQDVTTAIQAACTAASVTGGQIVFPAGTYLITSAITVAGSSTQLLGPARSVTSYAAGAIISASANIQFFTVTGSWVLFENLGLYCSNTGHTFRHINQTTGNFMSVVNCYIQGVNSAGSATGSGILFGNAGGADGGNVDRCIIDQGGIEILCSDVHITNSWCWANTRPYAVKVDGGSNIKILGCDILPPLTTVAGGKAGIYITNAALQAQVIGCYFDGNGTLSSGHGLLAEAGSIGLIVADCIANLLTDTCIVLDSLITPTVHHCTFYNGNKGRAAIGGIVPVDILLQQTGSQPMAQPTISDNKHIYTTTPGGTAGPAIRVLTGTAYNGMMIERNSIFSNGAGGGYADQEITLDDGLFTNSIQGSLSKNIGSRQMSCGSASATFLGTDTSKTINLPFPLYYQPRLDQVQVNIASTVPVAYRVQVVNNSQILIAFNAPGQPGTIALDVDL